MRYAIGAVVLLAAMSGGDLAAADRAMVLAVPDAKGGAVHLAVPLPKGLDCKAGASWRLREAGGDAAVDATIDATIAPGASATGEPDRGRVVATIPPHDGAKARQFTLEAVTEKSAAGPFAFKPVDDKSLGLWDGDAPVFVYNHGAITNEKVPLNDSRRTRGCFVHPLYGLGGETLTESFPKDHYHHHGLFWAWPHVQIDGKEYDLWVYNNIQQRHVRWLAREADATAAVLGVENGWFVGDRKVMIERVWLRAYKPSDAARAIDVEFAFIPVDRPVTLLGAPGKSYGGLNLRYAPRPEKDTRITVPSGLTKEDLPDTRLPWADLSAAFPGASAPRGAAIFVDPGHPDFPPTWLTRHYGVLCVGWPGVKPKTFQPGEPIRLNYRVWVHKDAPDAARLQQAFDAYAAGMGAHWKP